MICAVLLICELAIVASAPVIRKYHNYEELTVFLRDLQSQHSHKANLYSAGQSVKGRELWVIALAAKQPDRHVLLRPEVKLIGNMHGDETAGRELMLRLASYLLKNYNSVPDVTKLLDTARVHIMPSMNPDGFENSVEGVCEAFKPYTRNNARGFDLNRNFPSKSWRHTIPDQYIQKETRAVMDWLRKIPFVLSANFHGGEMVANYPYDRGTESGPYADYSATPDDDVFKHLALLYAQHNPTFASTLCPNTHLVKQNGTTNGAAWYPLLGGMQDYNYDFYGVMSITIELSCCKYPPARELEDLWLDNKNSLIKFLLEVNRGIRGFVLDESNNDGIEATFRVDSRTSTFNSTSNGEFWRILLPGDYVIQVQSPGYYDKKFSVRIPDGHTPLVRNFTLTPVRPLKRVPLQQSNTAGTRAPWTTSSTEWIGENSTKFAANSTGIQLTTPQDSSYLNSAGCRKRHVSSNLVLMLIAATVLKLVYSQ